MEIIGLCHPEPVEGWLFSIMFRQVQHDTRCCGLIRAFADSLICSFAYAPVRLRADLTA